MSKPKNKTLSLFLSSVFILIFSLSLAMPVFAAECKITLLWQWKDGKDYSATQPPPGELKTGDTVTAKAQFRNCNGSGNQMILVTTEQSGTPQRFGPADIKNDYEELSATMKIGVTGIYSFAGSAYNGSSTLAQVFSQQITVREKGGSGSGDVDSSVGGEYKFELEPFGPSDFGELIDTVVKWALNIAIPIAMII